MYTSNHDGKFATSMKAIRNGAQMDQICLMTTMIVTELHLHLTAAIGRT
jgi:hypothetical protein